MGSSLRVGPCVILTAGVLVAILRELRVSPTLGHRRKRVHPDRDEVLHGDMDVPESLAFEGQVKGTGFP